jgi:hypothetical protein
VRDARGFTDLKWRTPDDISMIMGRRPGDGNESHDSRGSGPLDMVRERLSS